MDQLLSHWLKIRPEERRQTALLFLLLFSATCFIIIGRTARDALLLSRVGIGQLPYMYLWIGVCSSLIALIYHRIGGRWSPGTALRFSLLSFSVTYVGLRLAMASGWEPVYSVLYVVHEVAGSALSVLFWMLANESFTTREAKRLFSVIGSGGVMAGTVCGFGSAWLAPRLGTENLLGVCVAVLVAAFFLAGAVRSEASERQGGADGAAGGSRGSDKVEGSSYARSLALMAVVVASAAAIIDFQFKRQAHLQYSEAELAAFFGILYGSCGLLSFVAQLLFTGRLLTRLGILPALLALPATLVGGAVSLIGGPFLGGAVFLKSSDLALRYSINETAMQLLYLPLPVGARRSLKAVIDGGLKPMALAVTGLAIAWASAEPGMMRGLPSLLLGLLLIWLGLAMHLRRQYVQALLDSLQHRSNLLEGVSVSLSDVASTQALLEALRSGDDGIVLGALELLPARRSGDWSAHVLPLLNGRGRTVRMAAMGYCRQESIPLPTQVIETWLVDPDDDIRAQAVEYLEGRRECLSYLDDPAPAVRARAIVGLVRNKVDEGAQAALQSLERMRAHPEPAFRSWAAWAIGELGGPEEGLRRLVQDPVSDVREEAIEAAGKAQLLGLVPLLVSRLRDLEVGEDAAVALGQYGEVALGPLLALFPLPTEDDPTRENVYRALRGVGTRRVAEELLRRLPADRSLRHEQLQVTFQLVRPRREGPLRLDQIRAPLLVEIQDCYQWWAITAALGQGSAWEVLRSAVREEGALARERAFLLLAHVYPVRPMQMLQEALLSQKPQQMANALEVLDELVEGELRGLLVPLLEALTVEERVQRGRALFPLVVLNGVEWCRYFMRSGDRWLKLCCLHTVRELEERALVADVRSLLDAGDPVVREAALLAILPMLAEVEGRRTLETFRDDRWPPLRRQATHLLSGEEGVVISSVDKVLFLKRVSLFSQLSGRELLNLAAIAEQVTFVEKAVIFEEGGEGDSLYLILSGQVGITRGGRRIATLGPRECFGEMAILDREPRSATVVALDQVSALRIERDSFYDLLAQKREIALGVMRILVQRLREANER